MRIFHLLATSLLAHLPLQLGNAARGTAASHKPNWRITNLDLIGNVENLDLCVELLCLTKGGVLLVHHDVTSTGHVLFVQTFDVKTNIVTRLGLLSTLMVHLDSEDFASAGVGRSVRGQEDDLLTRLHQALLHTPRQHIADTLNLVNARDWHAHGRADWSLWHTADLV